MHICTGNRLFISGCLQQLTFLNLNENMLTSLPPEIDRYFLVTICDYMLFMTDNIHWKLSLGTLSLGQTRKHRCGNIMFPINVSLFAHLGKHCCGSKICLPGRKYVSQQISKHFCCGNNVSHMVSLVLVKKTTFPNLLRLVTLKLQKDEENTPFPVCI